MLAGIEAGGTKFICATADDDGHITERVTIPTEEPEKTMKSVAEFFKGKKVCAAGIASFGPIDLNRASKTYGYIKNTPKIPWRNFDIVGSVKKILNVPINFDTDVNGAALAEKLWGKAKNKETCAYMTIGTGIGLGYIQGDRTALGITHPEFGHIYVKQHPDDKFTTVCPIHTGCLEGLASGEALKKRWNVQHGSFADQLPEKAWEIEAYYLAQACVACLYTIAPNIIVLGGGVMKHDHLYESIHKEFDKLLNGYLNIKELIDANTSSYITSSGLGQDIGICGAIALAKVEKDRLKL